MNLPEYPRLKEVFDRGEALRLRLGRFLRQRRYPYRFDRRVRGWRFQVRVVLPLTEQQLLWQLIRAQIYPHYFHITTLRRVTPRQSYTLTNISLKLPWTYKPKESNEAPKSNKVSIGHEVGKPVKGGE